MNLREIAKSATSGNLTFWWIPYATIKGDVAQAALNAIVPKNRRWHHIETGREQATPPVIETGWDELSDWGNNEWTFAAIEGRLVDVEASEGATTEEQAFVYYFRNRTESVADNWRGLLQILGGTTYNAVWDTYHATQDKAFDAVAPLNKASDDPEASGGEAQT